MKKYLYLTLLLVCTAFASCIDDLETCVDDNEIPEVFVDGYSLNLKVTLDNMGGTRAGEGTENPMAELENYIDPEKFRVLFFDRDDRFLFESKSRWVKQIVPNGDNDHAEWFVSVPLYDYGNDEAYNWKWEEIRRVLTGEDENDTTPDGEPIYKRNKDGKPLPWAFKIAILANRPSTEWNMGINGRYSDNNPDIPIPNGRGDGDDIDGVEITKNGWKLQNGPFWKLEHTRWGNNVKTVFDLHHCQYDPIYHGKSYNDRNGKKEEGSEGTWDQVGPYFYQNLDVYDFVSGVVKEGEGFDDYIGKPTMGATSTWVSWKDEDTDKDVNINSAFENKAKTPPDDYSIRKFVRLSKDHPIPMYGIQSFSKIGEDWVKGTPFNLSNIADGQDSEDYDYKSISLLRSVVKLELVIPKTNVIKTLDVAMIYPNIYARCEPMDVWTPTDSIWNYTAHEDEDGIDDINAKCEWYRIREYGPVSGATNYTGQDKKSIAAYQSKMSWFYGIWTKHGWKFEEHSKYIPSAEHQIVTDKDLDYPRIFNSCVQRNSQMSCVDVDYSNLYNDGNYHFIVYTGEKNINDPSNISEMGKDNNGAAPITSWWVRINNNSEYGFALAPYENIETVTGSTAKTSAYQYDGTARTTSRFRYYEARVQGYTTSNNQTLTQLPKDKMPWPLVRNHVYRIKIGTINNTRSGGEMSVQSEVLHSKSINFDKPKKKKVEKLTEKK